jgi:hypothetical protein
MASIAQIYEQEGLTRGLISLSPLFVSLMISNDKREHSYDQKRLAIFIVIYKEERYCTEGGDLGQPQVILAMLDCI